MKQHFVATNWKILWDAYDYFSFWLFLVAVSAGNVEMMNSGVSFPLSRIKIGKSDFQSGQTLHVCLSRWEPFFWLI